MRDAVSILPTPRANPGKSQYLNLPSIKNHKNPNLETVIANLPTPNLLPTPTTMDHLPQRGIRINEETSSEFTGKGRTKLANLREAVNPQAVELFNQFSETSDFTNSNCSDGTQSNSESLEKPIWKHAFLNSKERRTLSPNWTRICF